MENNNKQPNNRLFALEQGLFGNKISQQQSHQPAKKKRKQPREEARAFDLGEAIELQYNGEAFPTATPEAMSFAESNSFASELEDESLPFEVEAFEVDQEVVPVSQPVTQQPETPVQPAIKEEVTPKQKEVQPVKATVVPPSEMPLKSARPVEQPSRVEETPSKEELSDAQAFAEDLQAILNGEKTYDAEQKQVVPTSPTAPPPAAPTPHPHDIFDQGQTATPTPPQQPAEPEPVQTSRSHAVFDQMGKKMAHATNFDQGTVDLALEMRFDEFDRILDEEGLQDKVTSNSFDTEVPDDSQTQPEDLAMMAMAMTDEGEKKKEEELLYVPGKINGMSIRKFTFWKDCPKRHPEDQEVTHRIQELLNKLTDEMLQKKIQNLLLQQNKSPNLNVASDMYGEYVAAVSTFLAGGNIFIKLPEKESTLTNLITSSKIKNQAQIFQKIKNIKNQEDKVNELQKVIKNSNLVDQLLASNPLKKLIETLQNKIVNLNVLPDNLADLYEAAAKSLASKSSSNPQSANEIHLYWNPFQILEKFHGIFQAICEVNLTTEFTSFQTTVTQNKNEYDKLMKISEEEGSLICGIWIRHMGSKEHLDPKDMPKQLFNDILQSIVDCARSSEINKIGLILLGDHKAKQISDMPGNKKTQQGGTEKIEIKTYVEQNLKNRFKSQQSQPEIVVWDLRSFYQNPKSPIDFFGQYKFYALLKKLGLAFVVGAESGTMDALGYLGTQVISIDLTDQTSETPTKVITDRIGNYSLLSPLWQLINYQKGQDQKLFLEYLRGAIVTCIDNQRNWTKRTE